ncbi:MAG: D-alanyl-D-alanine carboxypeptidase family protein [Clostridiales Family XIII bacterium]|jgi:D-alanyl-D-alanine carboxypeptidase|nr:D-alanyl-D-alanine carboxypeptidase family protein [Clostridiales Family XIII bacterium]
MAFAAIKKIKSFLHIPAVHAAEDPEAERRPNIKSLDELLSTEISPEPEQAADETPAAPEETVAEAVTPAEPEQAADETPAEAPPAPEETVAEAEAPAEPEQAADETPAAPAPAEAEEPIEAEPAPVEEAMPTVPEETVTEVEAPAEPEQVADETPVVSAPVEEAMPVEAPPAPEETVAEDEAPAEPEQVADETPAASAPAEAEAPAAPETEATPADSGDIKSLEELFSDGDPSPEAVGIEAQAESGSAPEAEAPVPPAQDDADESDVHDAPDTSASATDEEQQKLHAQALRFANNRTGLSGLAHRLRAVFPAVAALVAGAFFRFKKSGAASKSEKFDVPKEVELAFSSAEEGDSPAETAAKPAQPEEASAPAQAPDAGAGKRKKKTPPAKNATMGKNASKKSAGDAETPLDKAAAKKAKEKEKKAAQKAKEDAKKAAKKAKAEALKAAKEAKAAAFAEKYPKKAAKQAEKLAKKEAKKAADANKKKTKADKSAKAAKAAARAAKKAQKEENKKPKLTKEEKFQLKLEKQATKHEKKIERFERKAQKIGQKLEEKHKKKEIIQGRKDEEKSIRKEQKRIRKERRLEIKKQRKYWLERGVGRARRNASVISLAVLILAAVVSGTTFLYKSERVNIPILNKAVQIVADSPVMSAVRFLDKPVRVVIRYAAIPVAYVIKLIQGEPKAEDLYFFEADKMERYEAFREANPDMPIDEVVWRVNAGADKNLYQDPVTISDFGKRPILVNKFRSLPKDYEPQDMIRMPDNVLMRANADAAEAFSHLREAAAQENLNITVASAYRSYEYQNLLYNPGTSDTRERLENYLSRPGFSENQSGLAFDLSVGDGRMYDFVGTPEAAWVAENAEKFGFILRYPADGEDVTGMPYQPWHIRYVGDAVVKTMRENNIKTLEEYCVKFVDHKPGDEPEKPIDKGGMTESADGPI